MSIIIKNIPSNNNIPASLNNPPNIPKKPSLPNSRITTIMIRSIITNII
jgi:hypothetical protein